MTDSPVPSLDQNFSQVENPVPQHKKMNKWILLGAAVLVLLGAFLFLKNTTAKPIVEMKKNIKTAVAQPQITPIPTPMPFANMTIPYLREQTYKSSLGNLEQVSDNATYTAYLTSYDSTGLKINGLLTRPKGEEPQGGWPAIVFVHGYIPPSDYRTQERYVDYVDYLARNGFVVFKIDLRGNGDSEGKASGAYYSPNYVIDTLNAYAALQAADFVNGKKIGIWGHSMAGNITLRALAAKPDIPAAVIWAGVGYSYVDIRKYKINDTSYRPSEPDPQRQQTQKQIVAKYGQPDLANPFWKQVAPISYLNEMKGAIEINHALDDTVVNIGYSRDLVAALDKTAVPHEYYEYPSGGHNISGDSFTLAMQRTVDFFKKYLE